MDARRMSPRTFGPDFLAWLRDATEQAWDAEYHLTPETFRRRGASGKSWQRGTRWGTGLSDLEIDAAEKTWGLTFPPDHRLFLRTLHAPDRPLFSARYTDDAGLTFGTAPSFFDWRVDHREIAEALEWPLEGIAFDVEHANLWMPAWGERPDTATARLARLRELVGAAPRLIPICGHRYLLGDPPVAGNPVFSIHQADIIVYGGDLRQFLLHELASLLGAPDDPVDADASAVPFWGPLLDSP